MTGSSAATCAHGPARPSVLSSWTRVILDALDARGIDPVPVLRDAGFARDAFADPNARLSAVDTARLWRRAAACAADPAFGLFASSFVRPTTFHALGYAVFASSTLRDALQRLLRYGHLVSDAADLDLETTRKAARLSFVVRSGEVPSDPALDAVISLIVRTCRTLTERSFCLEQLSLRRARPLDLTPYERFYRYPIAFDAPCDTLTLDPPCSTVPCSSANPSLRVITTTWCDATSRACARARWSTAYARRLAAHLQRDASPDKVATLLGMSARSLQRRLKEQGTSYVQVLRDTRRELAIGHLREPHCSVTEIAFLLGFEDASAFARAFRSWTGVTPSSFRAQR